jgi:hypothetical protein
MTTTDRLPVRRPTVIDGEIVDRQPNPHTVPTAITSLGLIATAIGSVYAANVHPQLLEVSIAADLAAIGVFLFNLGRHHLHEERQR